MRTIEEACDNIISPIPHIFRSALLCDYDAHAGRSLLLSCMDFWRFSMPSISIRVLQQCVRFHAFNDSHDYQSLHPHHVPTLISENLHNENDHHTIVLRMVYCISHYGEWVCKWFVCFILGVIWMVDKHNLLIFFYLLNIKKLMIFFFSVLSTRWLMGWIGLRTKDIFLYNTQEGRQIATQFHFSRRIFIAMLHHHFIILVYF